MIDEYKLSALTRNEKTSLIITGWLTRLVYLSNDSSAARHTFGLSFRIADYCFSLAQRKWLSVRQSFFYLFLNSNSYPKEKSCRYARFITKEEPLLVKNNIPKVAHWNNDIFLAFKMSRQHSRFVNLLFKSAFYFVFKEVSNILMSFNSLR